MRMLLKPRMFFHISFGTAVIKTFCFGYSHLVRLCMTSVTVVCEHMHAHVYRPILRQDKRARVGCWMWVRENSKKQGAGREMSIIVPRACGWGCYSNCFLSHLLVANIETSAFSLITSCVCSSRTFSISDSIPNAITPLYSTQLKG